MSYKAKKKKLSKSRTTHKIHTAIKKDSKAIYRGILRDRAKRRYSGNNHMLQPTLGKILTFDWDLFITDITSKPLEKKDLIYNNDYFILNGNFSGRIARYVGKEPIKRYGSFVSVRRNEVRVRCDIPGFATIPKIGCWMELLSCNKKIYNRPPLLLIQAKSIIGDIPLDEMHFAIIDNNQLISQWSYRKNIKPESIDLNRLEHTIVSLGYNKKKANSVIYDLIRRGFYVCYEDDGWLVKCEPRQRIRFMRRSNLFSITICRCGRDIVNAMMNDYTLRTLLPCRLFGGIVGKKQTQRPGHLRRSSTMMSFDQIDFNELLEDYDKSTCYARIFQREGAVDGNLLVLDTPYLDAIRSYISNGGLARNCICCNITKWRRMIKYAAGGDEPYLLMEDISIINGQFKDLVQCLPNNRFKRYSFSVIYYDGTNKINSPSLKHKYLEPVKPKNDLSQCIKRHLLMNGGYLSIALSRRGVADESLPILFDNVQNFIIEECEYYGYIARRVALGLHIDMMVYVDFQLFLKTKKKKYKNNKKKKKKEYDTDEEDEEDDEDEDDEEDEDEYEDEYEEDENENENENEEEEEEENESEELHNNQNNGYHNQNQNHNMDEDEKKEMTQSDSDGNFYENTYE